MCWAHLALRPWRIGTSSDMAAPVVRRIPPLRRTGIAGSSATTSSVSRFVRVTAVTRHLTVIYRPRVRPHRTLPTIQTAPSAGLALGVSPEVIAFSGSAVDTSQGRRSPESSWKLTHVVGLSELVVSHCGRVAHRDRFRFHQQRSTCSGSGRLGYLPHPFQPSQLVKLPLLQHHRQLGACTLSILRSAILHGVFYSVSNHRRGVPLSLSAGGDTRNHDLAHLQDILTEVFTVQDGSSTHRPLGWAYASTGPKVAGLVSYLTSTTPPPGAASVSNWATFGGTPQASLGNLALLTGVVTILRHGVYKLPPVGTSPPTRKSFACHCRRHPDWGSTEPRLRR